MTTDRAEAKTFRLSRRLSVEFTVGATGMLCEWDPAPPDALTKKELRAYRAARSQMLARFAEIVGVRVACVEIGSERADGGSAS